MSQYIAGLKLKITEVKGVQLDLDRGWQLELEDIFSQADQVLNQSETSPIEVYHLILRELGLTKALQ